MRASRRVVTVGVLLGLVVAVPLGAQSPKQLNKARKLLEKIKAVDGAGSGLDADTLQGMTPAALSVNHASSADNANHATTADNATNATNATTAANATGAAGPLASGQTLFGTVATAGHKVNAPDFVDETSISFPIPLAAAPTANVIPPGGPPTAACPGSSDAPSATGGNLCVYETTDTGTTGLTLGPTPFGANVFAQGVAAGANYEVIGVWAVQAP